MFVTKSTFLSGVVMAGGLLGAFAFARAFFLDVANLPSLRV